MLNEEDLTRPHSTRRRHQEALERQKRRKQRKRRKRVVRIRAWRMVNSLQFWTRTAIGFVCVSALVFWAQFAVVYDIPTYIQKGSLYGMHAYVAEKDWWFGPVLFNLGSYSKRADPILMHIDPTTGLLSSLSAYQSILENPKMIWVEHSDTSVH